MAYSSFVSSNGKVTISFDDNMPEVTYNMMIATLTLLQQSSFAADFFENQKTITVTDDNTSSFWNPTTNQLHFATISSLPQNNSHSYFSLTDGEVHVESLQSIFVHELTHALVGTLDLVDVNGNAIPLNDPTGSDKIAAMLANPTSDFMGQAVRMTNDVMAEIAGPEARGHYLNTGVDVDALAKAGVTTNGHSVDEVIFGALHSIRDLTIDRSTSTHAGTPERSLIVGGDGREKIIAGAGDDYIYAGAGDDVLIGGAGNDLLDGGAGNDVILAGDGPADLQISGNDAILAALRGQYQNWNDTEDDTISGGVGNDIVFVGGGTDKISLGNGNDDVTIGVSKGGNGFSVVYGGAGADTFEITTNSDAKSLVYLLSIDGVNDRTFNDLDVDKIKAFVMAHLPPQGEQAADYDGIVVIVNPSAEDKMKYNGNLIGDPESVTSLTTVRDGGASTLNPNTSGGALGNDERRVDASNHLKMVGDGRSTDGVAAHFTDAWDVSHIVSNQYELQLNNVLYVPDTLYLHDGDDYYLQNLLYLQGISFQSNTVQWTENNYDGYTNVSQTQTFTGESGSLYLAGFDVNDFGISLSHHGDLSSDTKISSTLYNVTEWEKATETSSQGIPDIRGLKPKELGDIVQTNDYPVVQNYGLVSDDKLGEDRNRKTHSFAEFASGVLFDGTQGGNQFNGTGLDDTITYSTATTGVSVNLAAGQGTGGAAAGQSFASIENAVGSAFADSLTGGSGANVLEGGKGDDTLIGLSGDDTYVYAKGDGTDIIDETGDDSGTGDQLYFSNLTASDIVLRRQGQDLIVDVPETGGVGGKITISDQFDGLAGHGIEEIAFADGVVWDAASIRQHTVGADDPGTVTILGTSGDDDLTGTSGNDTLDGGLGNDSLNGGSGSDTYVYRLGDGSDTIGDQSASTTDVDTLKFVDINFADVTLSHSQNDLVATINPNGNTLSIYWQFLDASAGWGLEKILFADGISMDLKHGNVVWQINGTDGNDRITSPMWGSAEVFNGGKGNDFLDGTAGSDIYLYASGDGSDEIDDDVGFLDDGNIDVLKLTDLNSSDIALSRDGNNLKVTITGTGDVITIDDQFRDSASGWGIEKIDFADGSSIDRNAIASVGNNSLPQTLTATTALSSAPVLLDLNGDGHIDLRPLDPNALAIGSSMTFDWNGDGTRDGTAWVGPQDGFLAIDLGEDGQAGPDGIINQSKELAFSEWATPEQVAANGGSVSDLDGLRLVFDSNHDNVLDASDDRWSEFRVWRDANQNGVVDDGELQTMSEAGIKLVNLLSTTDGSQSFSDGSAITGTSSYQTSDGTSHYLVGDATLSYQPAIAKQNAA